MRAENDFFVAGAVFERIDGIWRLSKCAPILNWMRGLNLGQIKNELLKRGCCYEWLPVR